jgi:opacity protein-like surface antigen
MKPRSLPVALIAAALAAPALAEEGPIPGGKEKFKFNLGTILNQNDTSLRLEGPSGRGLEFGLEGSNGVKRDVWSVLGSGTWRFAPNHRVGFQSFNTKRSSSRITDRELVLEDQTIPVGTQLDSSSNIQFLVVNYQYSLLRDDRVELSAMAGIYGARFKFGFDSTNPPRSIDSNTTAPLPMIGIGLDTFITPRWTVSTFVEGLALTVGDVKGSVTYIGMSTDYMVTRHFGLGLGVSAVHVSADVDKDNGAQHSFDWRSSSFFGYGQFRF